MVDEAQVQPTDDSSDLPAAYKRKLERAIQEILIKDGEDDTKKEKHAKAKTKASRLEERR